MTNPLNTPHGVASASLAEESLRRHKVELAPCAPLINIFFYIISLIRSTFTFRLLGSGLGGC